ncbi:MAG: GYF domain-containing protein [Verrucomicrobiota bacterium]
MQIHIARKGAQLGVFTSEEVRAGLATGRFITTDLAWREGMSEWKALGEWPDFAGAVPPSSPGFPSAAAERQPTPSWERGASFGNFCATIKEVALDPVRTFDGMGPGGFSRPISFTYASLFPAWLCGSAVYGGFVLFLASVANHDGGTALNNDPLGKFLAEFGAGAAAAVVSGGLAVAFLLVPLLNFIGAAVTHLLLLPWNPQGGYAQTYRAQAYAYGAFMPFAFIPCVNYVVGPWQVVAAVIAHSRVHRIVWWKVAISLVLVPCCCACGIYALLIAAILPNSLG